MPLHKGIGASRAHQYYSTSELELLYRFCSTFMSISIVCVADDFAYTTCLAYNLEPKTRSTCYARQRELIPQWKKRPAFS